MRFVLISLFIPVVLFSQVPLLQWQIHNSYSEGLRVEVTPAKAYCLSRGGLFALNRNDKSLLKLSKISGLSDVSITTIAYDKVNKLFFIGYENGNIDIIKNNQIINISDIYQKFIIGDKRINDFTFYQNKVYVACGFGIVVIDLLRFEIKETYYIGNNETNVFVNNVAFTDNYIYAATNEGVYRASLNGSNLANYQNWSKVYSLPLYTANYSKVLFFDGVTLFVQKNYPDGKDKILYENQGFWTELDTTINYLSNVRLEGGKLIASLNDKIKIWTSINTEPEIIYDEYLLPQDAVFDEHNNLWVADLYAGLRFRALGSTYIETYYPNGPLRNESLRIDCSENNIWVTRGAISSAWNNQWKGAEIYHYNNGQWSTLNEYNSAKLSGVKDVCFVKINPLNPKQVYFASYGGGLIEIYDGVVKDVYNENNSVLQNIIPGEPYCRVTGIDFDRDGNLWVLNSEVVNNLSVRKKDGSWVSIPLSQLMGSTKISGELFCSSNGIKWGILPKGGGMFAYSENGTLENFNDDKYRAFNIVSAEGELISNDVYCIAEDKDGLLWVGTSKGLVYYYNSSDVFTSNNFAAQRIKLPNEIEGQANYLFESETITAIAIDGANRKWIGTLSGGVFLMSADGQKEIYHFTTENSPLISNTINDIAIEPKTGDVFFATDKGVCSFRGTATEGYEFHHNVEVFPNPVRPEYEGLISIRGLVANAYVKITDISGNLIYETRAEGGQAVWNGKNFEGKRVATGVYLVFSTNEEGTQTYVTKLLFIK